MSRKIDITNQKFGRLTALFVTYTKGKGFWSCECDCGNKVVARISSLKNGHTKSCGCLQRETLSKIRKIHGRSNTSLYFIYKGINKRCKNKNEPGYKNYGGRGIKNEWKSFEDFRNDMEKTYRKGLSIERINNNGNYCKENCRWATTKEQNNNRRSNHLIKYSGKCLTISQWGDCLGLSKNVLYRRFYRGWSISRALNQTVK